MKNIDFTKWEYIGTDDIGTKAYISKSSTNKYKYMEIDNYGHVNYHN